MSNQQPSYRTLEISLQVALTQNGMLASENEALARRVQELEDLLAEVDTTADDVSPVDPHATEELEAIADDVWLLDSEDATEATNAQTIHALARSRMFNEGIEYIEFEETETGVVFTTKQPIAEVDEKLTRCGLIADGRELIEEDNTLLVVFNVHDILWLGEDAG